MSLDTNREFNNSLLQKAFEKGALEVLGTPNFIILDVCSQCNARCLMCWQRLIPNDILPRMSLSMNVVNKLQGLCDNLVMVNLFGTGEPLLNPELAEICEVFKRVISLEISTNGILLNPITFSRLTNAGMRILRLSCDSSYKEIFEYLRRGVDFSAWVQSVQDIVEFKRDQDIKVDIGINAVIHAVNFGEIYDLAKMAESLGLDFVGYSAYVPQGEAVPQLMLKDWQYRQARESLDKVIALKMPVKIYDSFSRDGVQATDIQIYQSLEEALNSGVRCKAVYSMMNVLANGTVTACPMSDEVLGDLNIQSFEEVWNGEKYLKLRSNLNTGKDIPKFCVECYCDRRKGCNFRDILERTR